MRAIQKNIFNTIGYELAKCFQSSRKIAKTLALISTFPAKKMTQKGRTLSTIFKTKKTENGPVDSVFIFNNIYILLQNSEVLERD